MKYKKAIEPLCNYKLKDIQFYTFLYRNEAPVPDNLKLTRQSGVIIEELKKLGLKEYIRDGKFVDYSKLDKDVLYQHHEDIKSLERRVKFLQNLDLSSPVKINQKILTENQELREKIEE